MDWIIVDHFEGKLLVGFIPLETNKIIFNIKCKIYGVMKVDLK